MKGVQIQGNIAEAANEENSVIFYGNYDPDAGLAAKGIYLFDEKMSSGKMSADIKFTSVDPYTRMQFIFNYRDEYNFYCAGVCNEITGKYVLSGMQQGYLQNYRYNGYDISQLCNNIHVEVEILYNYLVCLRINDVEVFRYSYRNTFTFSQIGIYVVSGDQVVISNIKVEIQRPKAFIISKFGGTYNNLYSDVIKPICEKHKLLPIRADYINGSTSILNDIVKNIKDSTVVIADVSIDNPNVFYELGYAYALQKQVIILCDRDKRDTLPFDIYEYRTIFYKNTIGGKAQLEEKLNSYMTETLEQVGI